MISLNPKYQKYADRLEEMKAEAAGLTEETEEHREKLTALRAEVEVMMLEMLALAQGTTTGTLH